MTPEAWLPNPAITLKNAHQRAAYICMRCGLGALLTLKEVQLITHLSRTTLWKAIKSGKLKPCTLGIRKLLFTPKAVNDFMNREPEMGKRASVRESANKKKPTTE